VIKRCSWSNRVFPDSEVTVGKNEESRTDGACASSS